MGLSFAGVWVLMLTAILFWAFLPKWRRDALVSWHGTKPYVAVAVCCGVALAFCLILLSIFGPQAERLFGLLRHP